MKDLYSNQYVSSFAKNKIGFSANGGTTEVKFVCSETVSKTNEELENLVGKNVIAGITTSGRVFDIEQA